MTSNDLCNIEAEQALLGAVLVNNEAFHVVSEVIAPADFYEPLHRDIFTRCAELVRAGQVANPVTVKSYLNEKEALGDLTVAQYLAKLAANAVTIINAPDYARAIVNMAKRRRMVASLEDGIKAVLGMPADVDAEQIGESIISDISTVVAPNEEVLGAKSWAQAVSDAIDTVNEAAKGKKGAGISYGFTPLERLIGPLFGGQLIILGGATKQGKTALAGQVATGAAAAGRPVWIYSGEMTHVELAMREIGRNTKIPVWRQKRGKVDEAGYERMDDFKRDFGSLPIMIQNRRLTIAGVKERARAFVRKKGKGLLVIDHIGLLERDKGYKHISDWEFGQEVTKELKALARELDCPIIACAQLKKNTFAENRGPLTEKFLSQIIQRKPRYTDLIGAVERDADHVVIPFRPVVFLQEHEPTPETELHTYWDVKVSEWKNKAQIVLALSRESSWPRHSDCGWDGDTTSFYETGAEAELIQQYGHAGDPMRLF